MNSPFFVNDDVSLNGTKPTNIVETESPTPEQNWQNSIHSLAVPLKSQQKKALRKLWQFLDSSEDFFLLGGYAGTGKTTIIFATIQQLLQQGKRVALTAPTNKAVTIRKAVKDKENLFLPFSHYAPADKSNGAYKVKERTLLKYVVKKIQEEFVNNPDCFRILCYTNKRVEYYNSLIREAVYGKESPAFIPGERLITKKPVVAPDGKTVILPTSCEITVTEVNSGKHYGYSVWKLKVQTDEGVVRQIFVLHEAEQKRYEAELENKHQSALRSAFLWRKYYWWKDDVFANVLNCFALTIHNSQGSTFDEGAVDGNDLFTRLFVGNGEESKQQKYKEYHRLWYVAASRYRHRLLFLSPSQRKVSKGLGCR